MLLWISIKFSLRGLKNQRTPEFVKARSDISTFRSRIELKIESGHVGIAKVELVGLAKTRLFRPLQRWILAELKRDPQIAKLFAVHVQQLITLRTRSERRNRDANER